MDIDHLILFTIASEVVLIYNIANKLCTYCNPGHLIEGKNFIDFDTNLGITGTVFTENCAIYKNGQRLEKNFTSIDNICCHSSINSYLFIPLLNIEGQKIGVLQLYNKKNEEIHKNDMNEFIVFQKIIGQLLDNVIQLNEALDYIMSAKSTVIKLYENISDSIKHDDFVFY